ncbi:MAG: hypothetical protein Q4C70_14415 [Planctomycetia bacterium]|nr:hypothetical protein [Planctomycetia bacterium]
MNVAVIEGDITLLQGHISDGQKGGVVIDDGGNCTFHSNTLKNNLMYGDEQNWGIFSAAHVTGSDNTPPIPDETF